MQTGWPGQKAVGDELVDGLNCGNEMFVISMAWVLAIKSRPYEGLLILCGPRWLRYVYVLGT